GLSIPEFGPVASPITNASSTPNIDAAWFVDFDELGPLLDIDVAAIANADTFAIAKPRVALWASTSPTSTSGGTQLAALDVSYTSGVYAPVTASGAGIVNPGGKRYLLVVSQNGSG
ncbi:MAG TPA: hypothetical protein VL383_17170, partial [Gemmatimonadaceae bacterium]|nr:hypothetical protein [Gemmatimonadaceae bacterium]